MQIECPEHTSCRTCNDTGKLTLVVAASHDCITVPELNLFFKWYAPHGVEVYRIHGETKHEKRMKKNREGLDIFGIGSYEEDSASRDEFKKGVIEYLRDNAGVLSRQGVM